MNTPQENKNIAAWHDRPLDSWHDIIVSFEYARYNTSNIPTGGFAVVFFDSAVDMPHGGGPDYALGYNPSTSTEGCRYFGYNGLEGAIAGVGFDRFGKFAEATTLVNGVVGAPNINSATIRDGRETGYNFVYNTPDISEISSELNNFTVDQQLSSADDITYRAVRVVLGKAGTELLVQAKDNIEDLTFTTIARVSLTEKKRRSLRVAITNTTQEGETIFKIRNFNVAGYPGATSDALISDCTQVIRRSKFGGSNVLPMHRTAASISNGNILETFISDSISYNLKSSIFSGEGFKILNSHNSSFLINYTGSNEVKVYTTYGRSIRQTASIVVPINTPCDKIAAADLDDTTLVISTTGTGISAISFATNGKLLSTITSATNVITATNVLNALSSFPYSLGCSNTFAVQVSSLQTVFLVNSATTTWYASSVELISYGTLTESTSSVGVYLSASNLTVSLSDIDFGCVTSDYALRLSSTNTDVIYPIQTRLRAYDLAEFYLNAPITITYPLSTAVYIYKFTPGHQKVEFTLSDNVPPLPPTPCAPVYIYKFTPAPTKDPNRLYIYNKSTALSSYGNWSLSQEIPAASLSALSIALSGYQLSYRSNIDPYGTYIPQTVWDFEGWKNNFGYSLQVDGNNLLVGHRNQYVLGFQLSGSQWLYHQTILPPNSGVSYFGYTMSLQGRDAMIGAPYIGKILYPDPGQGEVFHYYLSETTNTWFEVMQLGEFYQINTPGGNFGSSIKLTGNYCVVGSPCEMGWDRVKDYEDLPNLGRAYVFVKTPGGIFTQSSALYPLSSIIENYLFFGSAVGISRRTVGVTAPLNAPNILSFGGYMQNYNIAREKSYLCFYDLDCIIPVPPAHYPVPQDAGTGDRGYALRNHDYSGFLISYNNNTYLVGLSGTPWVNVP